MKDTIYREDAIGAINGWFKCNHFPEFGDGILQLVPSADRPSVDKDYLISLIQEAVYDGEACARLVDMVDRPQGDVDAVAIFEREMHNLERSYITLGEFDKRIEPLRHLCYGRPQGEWETVGEKTPYNRCPFCKRVRAFPDTRFCDWCGARMKGADDGEDIQSADE